MTKQLKPIVHGRDHSHGSADPVPIAYEDVGGSGGGGGGAFGAYASLHRGSLALSSPAAAGPIPWTEFQTTDNAIFQTCTVLDTPTNTPGDTLLQVYGVGWYHAVVTARWSGSPGTYNRMLYLGSDTGGGGGGFAPFIPSTHGMTPANSAGSSIGFLSSAMWTIDEYLFFSLGIQGVVGARILTTDTSFSLSEAYLTVGYTPTDPDAFISVIYP